MGEQKITPEMQIEMESIVSMLKDLFDGLELKGSLEFFEHAARTYCLWCSKHSIDPSGESLQKWLQAVALVESFRQWYASEKSKPFEGAPIRAIKQSWPQNHTPKTHTREKRIEAFLVDTLKGVFAIVGLDGSAEFFRQAAREFRLWCSELSIEPSCGEALAAWGKVMIGVYDFNQWCTSNEIEPLWGPFADPNTNNGVSDADGKALIDQMPVKCCENFQAFRGQEGRAKGHLVVFDGGKSA